MFKFPGLQLLFAPGDPAAIKLKAGKETKGTKTITNRLPELLFWRTTMGPVSEYNVLRV